MKTKEEELRDFFGLPVFGGNAIVSDDMKTIEIAYVNLENFSFKFIGDSIMTILDNKERLSELLPDGLATTFSISGWSIDGLDESNLGLINLFSEISDNYGASVIPNSENVDDSIGMVYLSSVDNSMVINQGNFRACLGESLWTADFIEGDMFDWDSFIKDSLILGLDRMDRVHSTIKDTLTYNIYSQDPSMRTLVAKVSLDAFQIARYGKDELYHIVEAKFSEEGIEIQIDDMEMKPVGVCGYEVIYECVPTDFVMKVEEDIFPDNEDNDEGEINSIIPRM